MPHPKPRSQPEITEQLLPYHDRLARRAPETIDLIVIHCTELPTLEEARAMGEKVLYEETGTGASGHYYIDRDGTVYRYVRDDRVAHHVVGHNQRSLGIELVNRGRYPHWFHAGHQAMAEPYCAAQIESLLGLLTGLLTDHPSVKGLAAHADLDRRSIPAEDDPSLTVRRRLDPGPLFPWETVLDRVGVRRVAPEALA